MATTWYAGGVGNMRALQCPDIEISMPVVRYGGIHQSLSGARTLDVTGFRQDITLTFPYMSGQDFAWLEALHSRHIPGPHRLINPMKENTLSLLASKMDARSSYRPGIAVFGSGTWDWAIDWPAAAGFGVRSLRHYNRSSVTSGLLFDNTRGSSVVTPGETFTAAIWLKSPVANQNMTFEIVWRNATGGQISASQQVATVGNTWTLVSVTANAPALAATGRLGLFSNSSNEYYAAAPQFVRGASVLPWELGGGELAVLIDQMPLTSPRYPLYNTSVVFLEA